MNDVLPKPFTKEGLLHVLDKHLAHLKKSNPHGLELAGTMSAPPVQPLSHHHSSATASIKTDDNSPAKSPATASNWNSPSQVPGVSPAGSGMTEDYINSAGIAPPHYGMPGGPVSAPMPTTPGIPGMAGYNPAAGQLRPGPPNIGPVPPTAQHRRQISEISGGADDSAAKRLQQPGMYQPVPMQAHMAQRR
jgi:osomolarity two-component system, response regulator SKN7